MADLYTGEVTEMIRQHGYAETFRILQERRKQAEPEQGDASEMSADEYKAAIEANKKGGAKCEPNE